MFKLHIVKNDITIYADEISTVVDGLELLKLPRDVTNTAIKKVDDLPYFDKVSRYTPPSHHSLFSVIFDTLCEKYTIYALTIVKNAKVTETFYYMGKKETNTVDGIFHIFEKIENLKTAIKLIKECGSDNLVRLDPLNESENQNKCTKDNNRWNRAAPISLGGFLARCSCDIPRDFISIDEQRLNQGIAKAVSESIQVLQPDTPD